MRQFAIGDVHGCLTALQTLLNRLEIEPFDKLIFLGDLIDRGPDSKVVIDTILQLQKQYSVEVIQGNHEEMLLLARYDSRLFQAWLSFGGRETLSSYGIDPRSKDVSWVESIPPAHWQFFSAQLVDCVEEDQHILVHAALDPELPLDQQPWPELRWVKWDDPKRHYSDKITVCGHTHQASGEPLTNGNAICIDTWVYGDGWLTGLELSTHRYMQTNQSGEFREGTIPPATTQSSSEKIPGA